jgi:hypothetical protein
VDPLLEWLLRQTKEMSQYGRRNLPNMEHTRSVHIKHVRLPRVFMVRRERGSGVAVTNRVSYKLLQAELELATREPT